MSRSLLKRGGVAGSHSLAMGVAAFLSVRLCFMASSKQLFSSIRRSSSLKLALRMRSISLFITTSDNKQEDISGTGLRPEVGVKTAHEYGDSLEAGPELLKTLCRPLFGYIRDNSEFAMQQLPKQQLLAGNFIRFVEVVLDGYLKETNSKLYCELSYFKTLLKNQPVDLQRIEAYVNGLAERREEFLLLGLSSVRKRQHSRSREKSLKVTLKPHHDRSKTSATSILDNVSLQLHHAQSQPQAPLASNSLGATCPCVEIEHLSQYPSKQLHSSQPKPAAGLSATGKVEGISLTTGCFQQMRLEKEREREREKEKLTLLKENAQYLANMFSRNSRKLTENDFFEKTRFKKKTVSESKGQGSGSGFLGEK